MPDACPPRRLRRGPTSLPPCPLPGTRPRRPGRSRGSAMSYLEARRPPWPPARFVGGDSGGGTRPDSESWRGEHVHVVRRPGYVPRAPVRPLIKEGGGTLLEDPGGRESAMGREGQPPGPETLLEPGRPARRARLRPPSSTVRNTGPRCRRATPCHEPRPAMMPIHWPRRCPWLLG